MVKIRLHGGFFVARLFPFKCCRRFTSFAICLQYPFGAGNRNKVLPRFLVFSGFITVKSQRWVFPFDNMQPLRCNSKRLICFFFLYNKKFLHNISRVRNLCNRWVFFCVNLAKLQCRCGKILFAMFAVQERKTTNFYTTSVVYTICATVGCFLCQFGKIAMQMHKNFLCNVCRVREKKHKFLHNVSRVRNLCNRWVFFCQFGKIAMQMRKNFVCNVCSAREKNHKIPLSWRLFA